MITTMKDTKAVTTVNDVMTRDDDLNCKLTGKTKRSLIL